jgi:steroid 5-alpha reductase family enzyme
VVLNSFLQIFMLQGLVVVAISAPVLITFGAPGGESNLLDWIGAALWLAGFLFELIADWQLLRFIRNEKNKGRIMRYGLWRYSRHPNYFGEALLWWGVFLIGLSSLYGAWGIVSPLLISYLLLRVSGIPMLEAKWDGNQEYEEYRERTNAFFPWFPRPARQE